MQEQIEWSNSCNLEVTKDVMLGTTKADTAEELAEAIETMETKDRKEKGGVSQCDSDTKFESII
jgi:hypothetical protein